MGWARSRARDGNAIYSTCVHKKEMRPTVLGGGVAGGVARARRGCSQNALGLLQSAPEATVCVCVCVCVCARVLGSHGFWSSLKRLRPCWPGKQGACSRAATHFFSPPGLVQVESIWHVDASSFLLQVLQVLTSSSHSTIFSSLDEK